MLVSPKFTGRGIVAEELTTGEWPWVVMHGEHPAWYQRSLIVGDFAPGRIPASNYAVSLDGDIFGPDERPFCGTCLAEPLTDELDVMERSTGNSSFLSLYRNPNHRLPWPPPTNPATCWYCNDNSVRVKKEVKIEDIAKAAFGKDRKTKSRAKVLVCSKCSDFVDKRREQKDRVRDPRNNDDRGGR